MTTSGKVKKGDFDMNENMKLTIENFFQSVHDYVDDNAKLYTKQNDKDAVHKQIEVITSQEKLIKEMMAERARGFNAYKLSQMQHEITSMVMPGYQVFTQPGSADGSVLVAYRDVIRGITEYIYYDMREESFLTP